MYKNLRKVVAAPNRALRKTIDKILFEEQAARCDKNRQGIKKIKRKKKKKEKKKKNTQKRE